MATEAIRCPACGGDPIVTGAHVSEDYTETWCQCSQCGLRGPRAEEASTARMAWNDAAREC